MADHSLCTIDGCNKPILNKSRGWCSMHYQRWRYNGDPTVAKYDRGANGPCASEGCSEPRHAKGLCAKHYAAEANALRYEKRRADRHATHGAINDLSLTEASYIAGLIDADGTVTVSSKKGSGAPQPLVLVVNSDLPLIEWLRTTVGAGCAYRTKTKPTRPDQNAANWNEVHRFQVTGWKALSLVECVRPFMRVKAAQADLLMRLCVRGRDFKSEALPRQIEIAQAAAEQVRRLNRRGIKKAG